jgi:hypothetical protein
MDDITVKIVRSTRRKKTVSARLLNWYTLEVRCPADIPEGELRRIIQRLQAQAQRMRSKSRGFASDEQLQQRAERLNKQLFGGSVHWRSIRFVGNQHRRFGSCSPARGTIRISQRLDSVPGFVLDYVIVHELAHFIEPGHSQAFWELVYRYRMTERARGYLLAMQIEEDDSDEPG